MGDGVRSNVAGDAELGGDGKTAMADEAIGDDLAIHE